MCITDRMYKDYAVVIIMAVFVFASLSWVLSARKWFKGPVRTVDDDAPPVKEVYEGEKKDASSVGEKDAIAE